MRDEGELKKCCEDIAEELGVSMHRLTIEQASRHEKVSERALRALGPWPSLKRAWWGPEVLPSKVPRRQVQKVNAYTSKLEREIADTREYHAFIRETLSKELRHHRLIGKPPKRKSPHRRVLNALISDCHIGQIVDPRETPGGEYHLGKSTDFFQEMAREIETWKPGHRDVTACNLLFNGDIIHGDIHRGSWEPVGVQIAHAAKCLDYLIAVAASSFFQVNVYWTPGNHDRFSSPMKEPGRQTEMKWDCHLYPIFCILCDYWEKKKDVNVKVNTAYSPSVMVDSMGHVIMMTHGDTELALRSARTRPNLSELSAKVNSYRLANGGSIDAVLLGHYHMPAYFMADSVPVIINGCMSGVDPYSRSVGGMYSHRSQWIFESTEKYSIGDIRQISLGRKGR